MKVVNSNKLLKEKADIFEFLVFLSVFSLLLWILDLAMNNIVLFIIPVLMSVLGVYLIQCRSKLVLYFGSCIILICSLIFTIGVTREKPTTVSSIVIEKWTEWRSGSWGCTELHMVQVKCDDSKVGYLVANLWGSSYYDKLRVGKQVKLTYHTESLLGVFMKRVVMDSIDSHGVLSGGGKSFYGSIIQKGFFLLTIFGSGLPLACLLYRDYLCIKVKTGMA